MCWELGFMTLVRRAGIYTYLELDWASAKSVPSSASVIFALNWIGQTRTEKTNAYNSQGKFATTTK